MEFDDVLDVVLVGVAGPNQRQQEGHDKEAYARDRMSYRFPTATVGASSSHHDDAAGGPLWDDSLMPNTCQGQGHRRLARDA